MRPPIDVEADFLGGILQKAVSGPGTGLFLGVVASGIPGRSLLPLTFQCAIAIVVSAARNPALPACPTIRLERIHVPATRVISCSLTIHARIGVWFKSTTNGVRGRMAD